MLDDEVVAGERSDDVTRDREVEERERDGLAIADVEYDHVESRQ